MNERDSNAAVLAADNEGMRDALAWLRASSTHLELALQRATKGRVCDHGLAPNEALEVLGEGDILQLNFRLDAQLLRTFPDLGENIARVSDASGVQTGTTVHLVHDVLAGAGPVAVPAVLVARYAFDPDDELKSDGNGPLEIRFMPDQVTAVAYANQAVLSARLALNVELFERIARNSARIGEGGAPAHLTFACAQTGLIAAQSLLVQEMFREALKRPAPRPGC